MAKEAVRVEHLAKSYGPVRALDDVSFAVGKSEVVGLLGPNGAGKTTTIEILEGMRSASSGTVRVLGRDPMRGGRRLRNRLGIVLQSAGIDAMLTVAEVVRLYAGFYRPRRSPAEVLEEVGLAANAATRVGQLSGGQRRRVDLALALVAEPALLFLDEPTTGLDPAARHNTWSAIERLRERGVAIVMTSHYLDEVQHLAERVIVLSGGRIVAEGAPGSLSGPASALTTISFRHTGSSGLPAGPWESTRRAGTLVTLETREPLEATRILLDWSGRTGDALEELEIRRPSLEEEYLKLTGGR